MAPSDHNNHDDERSVKMTDEQTNSSGPQASAESNDNLKNIAFAINYELPMVNQFLAVHHDSRRKSLSHSVENCTKPTQQLHNETDNNSNQLDVQQTTLPISVTNKNGRRISNMENNPPNVAVGQCARDSRLETSLSSQADVPTQGQQQNSDCSLPVASNKALLVSDSPPQVRSTLMLQSPVATIAQKRRVSTREKQKREIPLSRSRVKYDMQLVPFVRRNPLFLQQFTPPWWLVKIDNSSTETTPENPRDDVTVQPSQQQQHVQNRRSTRFVSIPNVTSGIAQQAIEPQRHLCRCKDAPGNAQVSNHHLLPFDITDMNDEADSVIWIPQKRSEWEDTISEMTAVYTAAAFRRHTLDILEKHQRDQLQNIEDGVTAIVAKPSNEPFAKPLSSDYIRDRIDIDDPLHGYQVRHKFGGWMQGFILYTTFTTWNHGFEFNSQHPLCGITPINKAEADVDNRHVDYDNALAMELEGLPRSGDPSIGGIVFSEIAEISILGALGCGEYLLRMALDDIYTNKENYKYVILHAADQARAFYEKFGFKRVGAVCKYSNKQNMQQTLESKIPDEPQVLGYRHWTHANEAILHDAPSYMMCLKLPDRSIREEACADFNDELCDQCRGIVSRRPQPGEFLRRMLQFQVASKPRIEPLGTSTIIGLKHLTRRSHSMPLVLTTSSFESQSSCPNMASSANMWMNHHKGKKLNAITETGTKVSRRKSLTPGRLTKALSFRSSDVPSANHSMRAMSLNSLNGSLTDIPPKSSKKESKHETSSKKMSSPAAKRLKVGRTNYVSISQESLPPGPKRSSFIEKQYNSVWLAVPPSLPGTMSQHRERAPPKSRTDASAIVRKPRKKSSTSALITKQPLSPLQGIKDGNQLLLPMIEEVDESSKTNDKSRHKHVALLCLPKDNGSTCKEISSALPTMKISRKRAFTETVTKSEKTKTSNLHAGTVDATEMASLSPRVSLFDLMVSEKSAAAIDTTTLRKQKVLSYPRNRIHYYNRVVRKNISDVGGTTTLTSKCNDDATCYFVLEYNEEKGLICIVPMVVRGVLTGKRTGRPRYQCLMDHKFTIVEADKFCIVPSAMIMKTPIVAQEAWDIATESDTDFVTR